MKRLNPETGQLFVKGDLRQDGYIFRSYTQELGRHGYFYEHWDKPNNLVGKKRNNPKTGRPFKNGDMREDGKTFRGYSKKVKQNGFFVELWYKNTEPRKGEGLKRINPRYGEH